LTIGITIIHAEIEAQCGDFLFPLKLFPFDGLVLHSKATEVLPNQFILLNIFPCLVFAKPPFGKADVYSMGHEAAVFLLTAQHGEREFKRKQFPDFKEQPAKVVLPFTGKRMVDNFK
jgi:hypothetical protein